MKQTQRSTFKLLFYLKKNAPKKNGMVAIMARITVDGKVSQFSTKLEVLPNSWDLKFGRVQGKSEEARKINQKLDKIRGTIELQYSGFMNTRGFATAEDLKNSFLGIGVMENTLLKAFKNHIQDYEKQVENGTLVQGTLSKYYCVYNALGEHLKFKYNKSDIAFKELTSNFIWEFDSYLRSFRGCKHNTVWNYMMPLRKVVLLSVKNGLIFKDPFEEYQIKLKETDRGFLMKEEIEKLIKYEPKHTKDQLVKDFFLFSCFTGLSYIDIKNLKESNIQDFFDGHKWIVRRRRKTNVVSNVRLMEIPLKLIEKYRGTTKTEFIFPIPTNTTCNTNIKKVIKDAGIVKEKKVTFHMARHTFATMFLTEGVSLESISKMMGHKDISTTQIYAKITSQKISNDMDLVSNKFKKLEAIF